MGSFFDRKIDAPVRLFGPNLSSKFEPWAPRRTSAEGVEIVSQTALEKAQHLDPIAAEANAPGQCHPLLAAL